ncbi:MAG TPA: hypothetical protein VKG44_02230 [Candidatus Baltobacteraceae bacterium]|nr:hypothetical protein [Candidatus Baltobacteraceae bacterium]
MRKKLLLLGACAVALMGATTQSTPPPMSSKADESHGALQAGQDIVLKSIHVVFNNDNNAEGQSMYYIVTLNFTNNTGYTLAPKFSRFTIEDTQKRLFTGMINGATTLIGIPDYYIGQLQRGESHDYTVGFRVPYGTTGTIYYDTAF